MLRREWTVALAGMLLCAGLARAGQQVTVTLVGGAKITAELLRRERRGRCPSTWGTTFCRFPLSGSWALTAERRKPSSNRKTIGGSS